MSSESEYVPDESELLDDVAENAVFNLQLLEEHEAATEQLALETDAKPETLAPEHVGEAVVVKKRRGRPRKNATADNSNITTDNSNNTTTNITTTATDNNNNSEVKPKKRGRPKGVRNRKIEEAVADIADFLDDLEPVSKLKKQKQTGSAKKNNPASSKNLKDVSLEDYFLKFNSENESKQELGFSEKETLKDQLTLLTKGQLKFEKIVGTSNKTELLKYAKCLNWFKTPLPPPTEENKEIKFIPVEENERIDISKIQALAQNTQRTEYVPLSKIAASTSNAKQRLTFDSTADVYELATNQLMKFPEKLSSVERVGYVLNHGINTQVTDTKWVNFKDRSFYLVAKLISGSYLNNAYSKELSLFYNPASNNDDSAGGDDLNCLIEIWEFKTNVGLTMLKDYTHKFGVVTNMDVLPGSIKPCAADGNGSVEFLLTFNAQSDALKVVRLNTVLQEDESMVESIKEPLLNIKYLNDTITSYCIIDSSLICVGTYLGRVAIFDLNVSATVPVFTARLGETLVDQLCSIAETSVIGASLYDGQVIIFDYKNISTTVTTISKNRWISPPLICSTDFPKGILHTDGQRSLFSSPLNCLDAKTCALDIATIISSFKGSEQHPYILVGTANGELNVVNSFIKTLLSKRNQSECVYSKIFSWHFDEDSKVYQLDGTFEVDKTIKTRGAHEIGFNYKGCAIRKCEWIENRSGERFFSFLNAAGITVVSKFD